jgi:hypothetical protein
VSAGVDAPCQIIKQVHRSDYYIGYTSENVPTNHRDAVDAEEQWVANLLNGDQTAEQLKQKGNEEAVQALVKSIQADFPVYSHAEHRGAEYNDLGDLKLIRDGDSDIYVELKNVEEGLGTLSNTGKVLVAEFDLVGGARGWDKFRADRGFSDWRAKQLDRFDYPDLSDIKGNNEKEKRARFLRDEVLDYSAGATINTATSVLEDPNTTSREQKAAEIVKNIYTRAEEGKHDYIEYLDKKSQNEENIRKLAILLLCGVHKHDLIKKYWDHSVTELESALDEYRIYIYNQQADEVFTKNPITYIESLSERDFDIKFPTNKSSMKIRIEDDGEYVPFLRISINWGNVFQGISTPSANTFLTGPATEPDWKP